MKKCKLCPYRRHCGDECYGENPCDFAKALDGLQKKNERLKTENLRLKAENEDLARQLDTILHPNF